MKRACRRRCDGMNLEAPGRTYCEGTANVPEWAPGGDKLNAKVTHDLRNVLTGLIGHLSLLREHPSLPVEISEQLALLDKGALRACALSQQLGSSSPEPLQERPATPKEVTSPAPLSAKRSTKRILAMDDEPGIRTLLSAALTHFGYEAITVPTGTEALLEYQRALSENQPFSA